MKKFLFILCIIFVISCARLRVEAPREPIKVDVSMRLDIYQHVVNDINNIEDIVSGSGKKTGLKDKESLLNCFVNNAYAAQPLEPEVENAALRRKDRKLELASWQSKGVAGENSKGLLEIKDTKNANYLLEELIKAENNDRMIIYKSLAQKNDISLEEMQSLYAKRLQDDAPSGTPIELLNDNTGESKWEFKK